MVSSSFGLYVLARACRRHRLRRRIHRRRNLNFRNLTRLTQIVRKRETTRNLNQYTQIAAEATFDAREFAATNIAEDDDAYFTHLDAADRVIPEIIEWHHQIQRDIRVLEASLFRMKDKYQGCSVNIYSTAQMQGMEYLHGIGWRGDMINPMENREIAERIDRLLQP